MSDSVVLQPISVQNTPQGDAPPEKTTLPRFHGIASTGNIYFNYNIFSACNYHRIILPLSNMRCVRNSKTPILFINRVGLEADAIDRFRTSGFRVVVDLDDDILLPPGHLLYDLHQAKGISQRLVENIRRADVVTVTNSVLAGKVAPYHRNIVVVPNALPFDVGQFSLSTSDEGRKIVYVGGFGHEADLAIIRDAVPRDEFTIAGDPGMVTDNVLAPSWQRIREAFYFAEFQPVLRIDQYMRHYDRRCISVAPLVDTQFNQCKSNLKALEAGAKGLAFVASRVHPYYNELDKHAVLYASSQSEWQAILKKLVNDPVLLTEQRKALAEHVRKHYHIRDANEIRRQIFESLSNS
ncbi:glycosyltransferase [Ralstonia solanacearum]|uniref:glycosyltransferase n=1 Tax=Ralstonia solanacearum TaxID=305 RepID=UPI0001D966A9|nr:glycosyltransferase [Ralstonia solanacearum]CBJ35293.1 conserved hypothethical protein [Ralstonia solanacearum PSI07]